MENLTKYSLKFHLFTALAVRILLTLYAEWHDVYMEVKYTDIDYCVFSDASDFVWNNESPYRRSTYRYTPLLALILIPNQVTPLFGKILFSLLDVICGALIYSLVKYDKDHFISMKMSFLWLYNPLPIAISTRGSAESIMVSLVLSVFCFINEGLLAIAAVIYGLSVHMKIYPLIYALPIYLYLGDTDFSSSRRFVISVLPGKRRLQFIFISAMTFISLTVLFYWCYGYEFLEETYLYHVRRKDARHNFSPYFYVLYLTGELQWATRLGLLAFIPQIFLMVLIAVYQYNDLPLCCFLQTFLFVTYNKVCTSQYFLWYLCLVPVIAPRIRITRKRAGLLFVMWFVGQGLWLLPAYLLEFQGLSTFLFIWAAGLLFFAINVFIAGEVVSHSVTN